MKSVLFLFAAWLLLAACNNKPVKNIADITGIDSFVKPGDNFYRYVNGKWQDTVQIPPSQAMVGDISAELHQLRLQSILDSVLKADNPPGSIEQKVADFYASGMDTNAINARGYEPVKPVLSRIDSIHDIASLMTFVTDEARMNNNSVIMLEVWADDQNSRLNIAHLSQSGIGLPDREYYFKTDPHSIAVQQAYKTYLIALFTLTGSDTITAAKQADIVYTIEKRLAASYKTTVELRDVNANYNKMAVTDLAERQPHIGWPEVLRGLGAVTDSIAVRHPAYYDNLNAALISIPLSNWKTYLKAHMLHTYANALSQPFADAVFAFNKTLSGQTVQKSRSEKMTAAVHQSLGEALGQLYVKSYFSEEAKKRAMELVNNLQQAFSARIEKLDWMSDSTRQKAKEKLFAIQKKIGYPDKWRDYSNIEIVKDQYFENVVSVAAGNYQYELAKLNRPVDRSEWFTTPATVNAYYNPAANEIIFPAAILQPPFFNMHADDALNYGGIGVLIGHELTHAFDDQGAQFDKNGNMANWWTKGDYERFITKKQQVIELYNTFTVLDTLHVNGALTVGENIADIGGAAIAYDAFKMTGEGQDTATIGGFTPVQRLFIAGARMSRIKMKESLLRQLINVDPHTPFVWRVNGIVMNSTPFYEAFHVQPGDSLYLPEQERIRIW